MDDPIPSIIYKIKLYQMIKQKSKCKLQGKSGAKTAATSWHSFVI